MIEDKQYSKAMCYVISWLARCEYSEWQMRKKLRAKDFDTQCIEQVVCDARLKGYLDDERFVGAYIRSRLRSKPIGPLKLLQYCRLRGISDALFWKVWNLENIDQISLMEKLIEKKTSVLLLEKPFEKKAKLQRFLHSRGFENTYISQVL